MLITHGNDDDNDIVNDVANKKKKADSDNNLRK